MPQEEQCTDAGTDEHHADDQRGGDGGTGRGQVTTSRVLRLRGRRADDDVVGGVSDVVGVGRVVLVGGAVSAHLPPADATVSLFSEVATISDWVVFSA